MLQLSEQQMRLFGDRREMDFRAAMASHLEALAPNHVQAMGAEALHELIAQSITRARSFDIVQRDTTRFWLELSVLWGIGFALDPSYDFAAGILAEPLPELQRMRGLHRAAQVHIRQVCGEDGNCFRTALMRLEARSLFPSMDGFPLDTTILASNLADIWPERADLIGSAAVVAMAERGWVIAERLALSTNRGRMLAAALAWFLGSDFADDPQYHWLLSHNASAPTGQDRETALLRRAQAYLRTVLKNA